MLCETNKHVIYKELVDRLRAGESCEAIQREITVLCDECRPSNPIMCMELCPVWRLKRDFREVFKAPVKRNLTDLLRATKNSRRLRILEALIEGPYSLNELGEVLKEAGYYHGLNTIRNSYVQPLVDMGFIKMNGDLYKITPWGENAYNILTKSAIAKLSVDSKGYNEKILLSLLVGPKTYDELVGIVPIASLHRTLKKLQDIGLINKSHFSGRVFYFKTKRRPTRKLSPTEMKIFQALPKEGITVKDLRNRLGVNLRRLYKYLRRLRYKRHVKKDEKAIFYSVTDEGRSLAQSLNMAYNLLQTRVDAQVPLSESPS